MTYKAKVGDKVRPFQKGQNGYQGDFWEGCSCKTHLVNDPKAYLLLEEVSSNGASYECYDSSGKRIEGCSGHDLNENTFIPLNSTISMNSIIEKIRLSKVGEPNKTLIKGGILDIEQNLTLEGQAAFNDFLYRKNQEEFAKEIAPLIQEQLDEDKNK